MSVQLGLSNLSISFILFFIILCIIVWNSTIKEGNSNFSNFETIEEGELDDIIEEEEGEFDDMIDEEGEFDDMIDEEGEFDDMIDEEGEFDDMIEEEGEFDDMIDGEGEFDDMIYEEGEFDDMIDEEGEFDDMIEEEGEFDDMIDGEGEFDDMIENDDTSININVEGPISTIENENTISKEVVPVTSNQEIIRSIVAPKSSTHTTPSVNYQHVPVVHSSPLQYNPQYGLVIKQQRQQKVIPQQMVSQQNCVIL